MMNEAATAGRPFDPTKAVCRVTQLPVSKALAGHLALEALLQKGLAALQETVSELTRLLDAQEDDPFLEIVGAEFLMLKNPNFHLLVDNFRNPHFPVHSCKYSQKDNVQYCRSSYKNVSSTSGTDGYGLSLIWDNGISEWFQTRKRYLSQAMAETLAETNILGTICGEQKTAGVALAKEKYYNLEKKSVMGYRSRNSRENASSISPIKVASFENDSNLHFLLENQLVPKGFSDASRIREISELMRQKLLTLRETDGKASLEATPQLREKISAGKTVQIGGIGISESIIEQQITEIISGADQAAITELADSVAKSFLTLDFQRANITPYDPMQLEDPNRGSWELWEALSDTDCVCVPVTSPMYARDPRLDIQDGGVIGIDFGTKSTVVVCQDDTTRIQPMRIGMGEFDRALRKSDYENPTIMQFIDMARFEEAYSADGGRPLTSWEDLTVSHTAFNAWKENDSSQDFFSFFGELKQWAGSPNRQVRLRDRKGFEISLPPYETLTEGDFDPIERYAYYIGLYINNMHTGRIYLEYLLSFPVTYPQKVRARILDSFRRGLRRSLPQTVLADPDCMERFSVEQGVGEPAAYAVCALQEYQVIPRENEAFLYGVFDFGGGTTDFDFGVWKRPDQTGKRKKHRYVIQHFGRGGDPYLGGENLLELLAFETFKANRESLLAEGIPFSLPPQCQRFSGSEALLYDSQEAHSNLRRLMEALRPLWERPPEYQSLYADGVLKLQLFRKDGTAADGFELRLDAEELEKILRSRIQQGVNEFFDALLSMFTGNTLQSAAPGMKYSDIHLFLAGNSSKSDILQEIFKATMAEYNQKYNDILEGSGVTLTENNSSHFQLFYPLGTEDSDKQMKELGLQMEEDPDGERPTGKTGVAIGLVQCRRGSKIKAVSETSQAEEIPFRYWVGDDEDGYFEQYLSRGTPYGQWVEYQCAEEDRFEFYYTSNPSAGLTRRLRVSETRVAHLRLPKEAVNEDWAIYLRPVAPNEIEYVVAESLDAANREEYRSERFRFLITKG